LRLGLEIRGVDFNEKIEGPRLAARVNRELKREGSGGTDLLRCDAVTGVDLNDFP
jgi:hypothetical protein